MNNANYRALFPSAKAPLRMRFVILRSLSSQEPNKITRMKFSANISVLPAHDPARLKSWYINTLGANSSSNRHNPARLFF